jgi:hypothetical protein
MQNRIKSSDGYVHGAVVFASSRAHIASMAGSSVSRQIEEALEVALKLYAKPDTPREECGWGPDKPKRQSYLLTSSASRAKSSDGYVHGAVVFASSRAHIASMAGSSVT